MEKTLRLTRFRIVESLSGNAIVMRGMLSGGPAGMSRSFRAPIQWCGVWPGVAALDEGCFVRLGGAFTGLGTRPGLGLGGTATPRHSAMRPSIAESPHVGGATLRPATSTLCRPGRKVKDCPPKAAGHTKCILARESLASPHVPTARHDQRYGIHRNRHDWSLTDE